MILAKFVIFIFPKKYHLKLREIYYQARGILYRGDQMFCPSCSRHFRTFLAAGTNHRSNVMCPGCSSRERQRLLALYLENRTNFFQQQLRVLHFAPEYIFQKRFSVLPNLDYISADLQSKYAQIKMDITNIPCKDSFFDVILCSHVLEHVHKDKQAMRELFRVLKPGGWAILQVPIDSSLRVTFEDPEIVTPEDRKQYFGQSDHVRLYGRDYKDRLEEAGFSVKVDGYVRKLDTAMIEKCRLNKDEDIYCCTKMT